MTMSRLTLFVLLPLLLLATGCSTMTYRDGMKKIHPAFAAGDFNSALAVTEPQVSRQTDGSLSNNALLWRLNHATILAAAGAHETAEPHWEAAQPMFEQAWETERFNITQDSLGLFVPGVRDTTYYARPHEGVMLYTYRMLNALHLGDIAEARRFLVLAMDFRDEVLAENEARIERRRARGVDNTSSLTRAAVSDGLENNPNTNTGTLRHDSLGASGTLLGEVENQRAQELREDLEGYANYANPLTGFLTYLFLRTQGTGLRLTDENFARRELNELSVFAPRNSVVRDAFAQNTSLDNSVFVFFETGVAPRLVEERVEVPIPSQFISYAGVAWPRLERNPHFVQRLNVSARKGRPVTAELLANFDAITQQSFDDAWPGIITRQIAQSIVNIAVNVAVNIAARNQIRRIEDPNMRLLAQVTVWGATAGLSYAMIEADTRSWELLPKQIHVARLDIPEDRTLTLSFPNGTWRQDITLGAGDVMAVWVKSTSPWQAAPLATQFKFR